MGPTIKLTQPLKMRQRLIVGCVALQRQSDEDLCSVVPLVPGKK